MNTFCNCVNALCFQTFHIVYVLIIWKMFGTVLFCKLLYCELYCFCGRHNRSLSADLQGRSQSCWSKFQGQKDVTASWSLTRCLQRCRCFQTFVESSAFIKSTCYLLILLLFIHAVLFPLKLI